MLHGAGDHHIYVSGSRAVGVNASFWPRPRVRLRAVLLRPLQALEGVLGQCFDLLEEFITHRFFRSLGDVDWSAYQLGPLVVASLLINLLELASPLYINIVYTSVLPSGSMESLLVLSSGVVLLMLLGGWLKTVRLGLTGADGARLEHCNRLMVLDHFCRMPLDGFLRFSPAAHLERLNSINTLRDEASVQAVTTAIDLVFSLLFVLVLFLIGGSIGVIAVIAIIVYLFNALRFARSYEQIARQRDALDLARSTYQNRLVDAIDLIKANGLARRYLVGHEQRQEELAHQRVENVQFSGQYQAFGSLTSQITLAAMVTWGAYLVISDRLMVGALAACLLLAGKVIGPWQQAMGLWNSYRRLSHARDQYEALMAEPVEAEGGEAVLRLHSGEQLRLRLGPHQLPDLPVGGVAVLRDDRYGADGRQLFLGLLQLQLLPGLQLNERPIEAYKREALRHLIAYVSPAADFFDGTLLQNITSFQPGRHRRRALFWSFLCGLDVRVRQLPQGYATPLGNAPSSGLTRDALMLAQLVRALATGPQLLLIDLNSCSYGKEFVDGLQRILRRCNGRITVLISGGGRVLESLANQQLLLPHQAMEALS